MERNKLMDGGTCTESVAYKFLEEYDGRLSELSAKLARLSVGDLP